VNTAPTSPDARLYIGTHCPHCPGVLAALAEQVKQGRLGRLEVINVEQRPDLAREAEVRGVPFLQLGPFELEGNHSAAELKQWIERAATPEGLQAYISEMLSTGQIARVERLLRRDPQAFHALLPLLADPDTELSVRIGIGALMETFAGTPGQQALVPELGALTRSDDARTRNDAAYYLGLSHAPEARAWLEPLREDADADVRETALEALGELAQAGA